MHNLRSFQVIYIKRFKKKWSRKKGEPKFIIWSPPTFRKIVLGVLMFVFGIWLLIEKRFWHIVLNL